MVSGARRLAAAALVVGGMALLVWMSRYPMEVYASEEARLRLSWRFTGETVEECETLGPRELERLPAHMRTPRVCTGRVAPYRLELIVDGTHLSVDTIRPAGARSDRPIYVFKDIPLASGAHRVQVRFHALLEAGEGEGAATALELERVVRLASREIVLVTYDPSAGGLVIRRGES